MSARTDLSTDANATTFDDTPAIRRVTVRELRSVLEKGMDDFFARPTHGVFLVVIYLLIAVFAALIGLGDNLLPLIFPLISGIALIGPLAACGLYELSRRRENGQDYAWWHVFDVFDAPSRWGIAGMGIILAAIFVAWMATALALYGMFLGDSTALTLKVLIQQVFTTTQGWQLLLVGGLVGFVYSVVVYVATVVSLPMMLHHRVSLFNAVKTSLRAVQVNWRAMTAWYFFVVVMMIVGSLPLFIGLAVVVPVLGHATWHLYRRLI
jgi:uncharacterized membrane protein